MECADRSPLTLVALDTETTGLSARYCELVEVAAVRFEFGGRVLGKFDTLIDPGCDIPYSATAVHGITNSMVRGQPTIQEAIPRLFDFLAQEPSVLLIHNAGFDLSFLKTAADRLGILCPECPVICTLCLARRRLKEMRHHRLDLLVQQMLGGRGADHRAGGDSEALRRIFLHMVAREPAITSIPDLLASARVRPFVKVPGKRAPRRLTRENAQV